MFLFTFYSTSHLFVLYHPEVTQLTCRFQRKHQLFSSVHSGHNVTADHALGHRGNVLYGNFVEDEVDEDNIKL